MVINGNFKKIDRSSRIMNKKTLQIIKYFLLIVFVASMPAIVFLFLLFLLLLICRGDLSATILTALSVPGIIILDIFLFDFFKKITKKLNQIKKVDTSEKL